MSNHDVASLIEDNFQLTELQQHPGWAVLMRYVKEWLESHERRLMSGQIEDLQEYKLVAGRTDGIRQILDLPDMVARMLETAKEGSSEWVDEFIPSEEYPRDTHETTVGGIGV